MRSIPQILAVLAFVMPTFVFAVAPPGISDEIQLGDPASESRHAFQAEGAVAVAPMRTRVGLLQHERKTRAFSGINASARFELEVPKSAGAGRVLLEIEEVHDRRPECFGYTILAGGKEVYFRTYEELSAGPNHYFVEIDRNLVGENGKLPVRFRSESGAPFNISRVWVYPDFDGLAEREQVYNKMGVIVGLSAELAGIKPDKKSVDLFAVAAKLKELYGGLECYEPGLMTAVQYARRSWEENQKGIDQALEISIATGMPVHLMFSSWWGTSAIGPDHLGGYFSDLRYEEVRYNERTRSFQPSFPNNWGNTMWPTKHNPHLNLCNNYRIETLARYLADRQGFLRAAGKALPDSVIYAEMGPSYGADYNPAAIAAAGRDGVRLDPTDGTSREEAFWIYNSYAKYFAQQVPAYRSGLGRGDLIVADGTSRAPSEPLLDNIYTHGFWGVSSPLYDRKHAYWQCGLNDGMWSSGELYETYPQAYYDYIHPISRVTCVNLERPMVKDLRFLKAAYGNGLAFVTLFNAFPGDEKFVREVDRIGQESKPPVTYRRRVLDIVYARDGRLESGNGFLSASGLKLEERKVTPVASGTAGRVLYRVRDPETSFAQGLFLELEGTGGKPGKANGISVFAGKDPKALQKIPALGVANAREAGLNFDLGPVARGNAEIVVAIELLSEGRPEQVQLKEVAAFVPWPKPTGQPDGSAPTLRQSRLRSLWLQQRARLDRVEANARQRNAPPELLQQAAALREKGLYASAWRLLTAENARLLPARYTVRGKGRLDPHAIEVELPSPDSIAQFELLEAGAEGLEFRVNVSGEQKIRLTAAGMKGNYALKSDNGLFVVQPFGDGPLAVRDGKLSLELDCLPPPAKPELPVQIVHPVETVQLPRKSKGKYESETGVIKAFTPPSLTGETCNGIVELESGNRYELGYTPWWTQCDLVGATGLKSLGLDGITQAFRPGQPIRIEYEPVVFKGRVPRIQKASQPTKLLFQEDYTKTDAAWASRALEVNGLHVADYRGKKLYPTRNWTPGHVVYRINSPRPLGSTAVGFTGRMIIDPENRIAFSVRTGEGPWKPCGEFITASPGANDTRGMKFVDLSPFVEGKQDFDLKVEILTTNSTWASLFSLQVRTLDFDQLTQ